VRRSADKRIGRRWQRVMHVVANQTDARCRHYRVEDVVDHLAVGRTCVHTDTRAHAKCMGSGYPKRRLGPRGSKVEVDRG
jgi:hypothetical protein